jgi:capsular polysaccharide biosynthesis protein
VAAGVVASIALSFLLAILLELLDAVVVSPSHLESLSGRPILGSVPRVA